jgi:F0F1-type ATP synthase assembly protein I
MAREAPTWSNLLGIGSASGALLLLGLGLGWWLDSVLHTSPVLVLVGCLLGIVGAISYAYFEIRKYFND